MGEAPITRGKDERIRGMEGKIFQINYLIVLNVPIKMEHTKLKKL